ncbi:hypothetical protein BDV95DRAFT_500997 [Massariosphaeria phaeospora]|uniref:Uncharacterized protein n=1 Tax=Massariosphaeria phaeospora TaxID=100035 RepID=A0A7C8I1A2_9PLEO|nr:hypothetical protein BDV95DRAFT_500997 [Massariosphaeria phaeospora]
MPVTTRAQSRRQAGELRFARKPSKAIQLPSKSIESTALKQPPATEETQSRAQSPSQASENRSPSQASSKQQSLQILAKDSLLVPSSVVERKFWPCQKCSCQEGAFEGLVNTCITCGHTMDDHEPDRNSRWKPNCSYLCMRDKLVISVLQHTREYGVMIIRATPMSGKTSLLKLLGHHIVHNELDLEPVLVYWKNRDQRAGLACDDFLQNAKKSFERSNAETRPCNPAARTIYLIDEAQGSYDEETLWSMFKTYHGTRAQALYILVCVYGVAGVSLKRDPNVESQAQRMHALQRIELHPSTWFSLGMLLRLDEVAFMVEKFATTLFIFASPLHRRVAYRRLFPGREPDVVVNNLSLQQICTNAIARFSPEALQPRQPSRSNQSWGIPEAAFQAELYSCLSLELYYLPILSQYSHTKDGRIDLFVAARKWGIEILRNGTNTEIAKHISRFTPGGNYHSWGLMNDYIILNFCTRSALAKVKIQGMTIHSKLFHVVIEPDKLSAQIYTYDKQLHTTWSLGEGRQRKNLDDFCGIEESLSDAESKKIPTQNELMLIEEMNEIMERGVGREKAMRERERQHMEEIEELRRQIEQMKEGSRLRVAHDQD